MGMGSRRKQGACGRKALLLGEGVGEKNSSANPPHSLLLTRRRRRRRRRRSYDSLHMHHGTLKY